MTLEREIKTKFDLARETLLGGQAPDYATYCQINARYQVLRELMDFIKERQTALASGENIDAE